MPPKEILSIKDLIKQAGEEQEIQSNNDKLSETTLTWVVGAAIRSALVKGTAQAKDLLKSLGVSEELVDLASEHCPGLGGKAIWAFHLERHGWLTATPVES
jgi:hypothetical protein